ncbi:DNA-binding GntR family transcriptional regulator [Moryella indoligenes]|uniref:DNA-binding GntR family transcriptional regulator n=1 Tax=Moryella indoligenes TaxID=371674 RepID=A0AAE3V9L5_9FIRM|nr:GntR family transcriptional regulator [Moryella indoligenes]MDQ0152130.1 DNA-binding GntR family transcriptional regulator [Moryella indoligenes]
MNLICEPRREGETAREYAYSMLRENIANLNLEPGCTLNDTNIAAQLGISRTPVREAINQLKGESEIIEIYPQRGMKVALIDINIIRNVRLMRMVLEKEMIRRCCDIACEEDILWMEENVALQHFYHRQKKMQQAVEVDNQLHRKFYELAGFDYVYRSTRGPMIHYDRVRVLESFYDTYLDSIRDHSSMICAVRERNPAEACRLMEQHLDRWLVNERRLRAEYPHYFKKEGMGHEGSQNYAAG